MGPLTRLGFGNPYSALRRNSRSWPARQPEEICDLILEENPSLATPRALTRFLCGLTSPATTKAKLTKRREFGCHATVPFRTVLAQVETCWAEADG